MASFINKDNIKKRQGLNSVEIQKKSEKSKRKKMIVSNREEGNKNPKMWTPNPRAS